MSMGFQSSESNKSGDVSTSNQAVDKHYFTALNHIKPLLQLTMRQFLLHRFKLLLVQQDKTVISRSETEGNWLQETQFNGFICLLLLKREKYIIKLNSVFLLLVSISLYSGSRKKAKTHVVIPQQIEVPMLLSICSVNVDSLRHMFLQILLMNGNSSALFSKQ